MGEMVIINDNLKSSGVSVGDKVSYKPFQEYEFIIDGEKMYRMYDHSITMVL
jgi:co-chaperonin GroES (HSP10)